MQTVRTGVHYGDAEYEHVFDASLEQITGKDVIAHLNPLRSKPRVFCLSLTGKNLVFPVKEVDKYLKRIDKFGKRIRNLALQFDPSNSVELLDMIVERFPHTRQLYMIYSPEHPVEHGLKQLSQLPNLINTIFPFPVQDVVKSMQKHQFTPFPKMFEIKFQVTNITDEYSHYETILRVLFPNVTRLVVSCRGKVLEDIEANIRTVLPKLKYLQTVDFGPLEGEIFFDGSLSEIVQQDSIYY